MLSAGFLLSSSRRTEAEMSVYQDLVESSRAQSQAGWKETVEIRGMVVMDDENTAKEAKHIIATAVMSDWDEEAKVKMKAEVTLTGVEEVKGTGNIEYMYQVELKGVPIEKMYNEQIQARINRLRGVDDKVYEETITAMHKFHDDISSEISKGRQEDL